MENEAQRQAALSWMKYWKASVLAGGQSWLAGEQALAEIMVLRQRIDEEEKRTAPTE